MLYVITKLYIFYENIDIQSMKLIKKYNICYIFYKYRYIYHAYHILYYIYYILYKIQYITYDL